MAYVPLCVCYHRTQPVALSFPKPWLTLVANMNFGGEIGSNSFVSSFLSLYVTSVTLGEVFGHINEDHAQDYSFSSKPSEALAVLLVSLKASNLADV